MGIKKRLKGGAAKRGIKALKNSLRKQRSRLLEWADREEKRLQAVQEVKNRMDNMREMGVTEDIGEEMEKYREILEEMERTAKDGEITQEQVETFKSTVRDIYDRAERGVEINGE